MVNARPFAGKETVVLSPDPSLRWRIGSPGIVDRSTDGGSTWRSQPTEVAVTPIAVASPAPLVCWLVGPGGTVLLSIDGDSWRRLAFPETVDLIAVRAASGTAASVTAIDGRTFQTRDAGVTWIRQ
jgi:photosystem II stability/assembly factor-like uncharacterized protein